MPAEYLLYKYYNNFVLQLHCCGVFNYTDWFGTINEAQLPTNSVPVGCCRNMNDTGCNMNINGKPIDDIEALIYTNGCFTKFIDIIDAEALWLIIGAIVLGLVQVSPALMSINYIDGINYVKYTW